MKKVSQIFVVTILSLFMTYNLPISVFATEEEDSEVTFENEYSYTVDTRYKTPFKSYSILTGNIPVYDAVTRELLENHNIYGDMDFCTIKEVYVDGWCLVESSGLEAQVPLSVFVEGEPLLENWQASKRMDAYAWSTGNASCSESGTGIAYVDVGDDCLLIQEANHRMQVIYPAGNSYKMGWIDWENEEELEPEELETQETEELVKEALKGYSLSLEGDIGVNFFLDIPDALMGNEDVYVSFSLPNGKIENVNITDSKVSKEGYYIFSSHVSAKDMTGEIVARLHVGNDYVSDAYSYTVEDYANYLMDHSSDYDVSFVNIAKAMMTYGYYAQVYFETNLDKLPARINELVEVDFTNYECLLIDNNAELDFLGARLILTSKPGIRLYFSEPSQLEVDGEVMNTNEENGFHVIQINNIDQFEKDYRIFGEDFILFYNVFSYGNIALQKGSQSLKDLMKAMYSYNETLKNKMIENEEISILSNPKSLEVKDGEEAAFRIKAIGSNLSYNWQVDRNDGNSWVSLNENKNTIRFVATEEMDGYSYRCILSNNNSFVYSQTVSLSVKSSRDYDGYEILSSQSNNDGITTTSFKYGSSTLGRDLVCWSIEGQHYNRTILLNFEIHGYEDNYARDGQLLVDLGNALVSHYADLSDLSNTRLLIIPSCNPDGLLDGTTNNGFGRCNAEGIDLNRDFDASHQVYTSVRNYTLYPFSAKESQAMRDLVLQEDPSVVIDFHGWENSLIGNADLAEAFSLNTGINHKNVFTTNAHGYFSYWAQLQGAEGLLVEFKDPNSINTDNVIGAIDQIMSGQYGSHQNNYELDSRYKAYSNISTHTLSTGKVYVQKNIGDTGTSYGYIDGGTDVCTIKQIYSNGWCKIGYPSTSNYTKTGYVQTSEFIDTQYAIQPYSIQPSKTVKVYTTSSLSTQFGSVWSTDTLIVIGKKGSLLQVIYPLDSGGYKMGWINETDL